MGVLTTLTDEYFGASKREEDCLVLTPREREYITILDEDRPLTTYLSELLQNGASEDVAKKRCCYRYGATLFDQYCDWNKSLRSHLEAYKYGLSEHEMLEVDSSGKQVALPYPDYK